MVTSEDMLRALRGEPKLKGEPDIDTAQSGTITAEKMLSKIRKKEPEGSGNSFSDGLEYAKNLGLEALSGAGRGVIGGVEYALGLDPQSQKNDALWAEYLGMPKPVPAPSIAADILPQKGDFAGQGLATDVASMAGEYGAPAGLLGRVAGKAPAVYEGITGALSGAGSALFGEAGERIGGEKGRAIGEVAGGMLSPMVMDDYIRKSAMPHLKSQIKDKTAKKMLDKATPSSGNLKQVGREIYKEIDDLGGFYSADQLSGLSKSIEKDMTDFGISQGGNPRSFAIMSEILEESTKNQTTKGLDNLRKRASNLSRSADGAEKEAGRVMSSAIDDFMDKNSPISSKSGVNLDQVKSKYKDARKIWRQAKKSELLELAFENSQNAATGVQNGLKNEFRSLLKNKKTRGMWSAKERKAMESLVQGDLAENAARYLGTMGFPIDQARNWLGSTLGISAAGGGVTVAGGPAALAMVAVPAIGTVSRYLSDKMTRNKFSMTKQLITAGDNGVDVVKAYLKNTTKNDQTVEDLTQLLAREGLNKSSIKRFSDSLGKDKKKLVRDALFFSAMPQFIQQVNQAPENEQ